MMNDVFIDFIIEAFLRLTDMLMKLELVIIVAD